MPSLNDPAALAPIDAPVIPRPRQRKPGNTLSAYKSGEPSGNAAVLVDAAPKRRRKPKPKTGPKPKPKAELYSEQIALMLTPDQRKRLEAKAGLAPMGKYVRHILETQTDIFKAE